MENSQVLIDETGHISDILLESSHVRPGCLGRLEGPICDWKEPTQNNHYYTRNHWKRVFNLPWVKKAMETKTLFGEADHPDNRVEPRLKEAAVVLTEYQERPEEMDYYGKFDILDTPSGRILRTLAEYGSKLGVSSRGKGTLKRVNGRNTVDENTYIFGGFDVVAIPAVAKARQEFIKESEEMDGMKKRIKDQISECATIPELTAVKTMLSKDDTFSDIVESIDEKINKMSASEAQASAEADEAEEKEVKEEMDVQDKTEAEVKEEPVSIEETKETESADEPALKSETPEPVNDTITDGLMVDLRKAYETIAEQTKKIESLEDELQANTIDREESIDNIQQINALMQENQSYADVVEAMRSEIESKTEMIQQLSKRPANAASGVSRSIVIGLKEQVQALRESDHEKSSKLESLQEQFEKASLGLKDAQKRLTSKTREAKDLHEELKDTQKELLDTTANLDAKNEELQKACKELDAVSKNVETLASELSGKDHDLEEAQKDIKALHERLDSSLDEAKQLEGMLTEANGNIEDAASDLDEANKEIERLENLLAEKEEKIAHLEADMEQMEEEKNSLDAEAEESTNAYNGLVDEYNSVLKENEKLRSFYLEQKAARSGYTADALRRILPEGFTMEDVDAALSSRTSLRRKMSSLPISNPAISSSEKVMQGHRKPQALAATEGLSTARSMLESMNRQ